MIRGPFRLLAVLIAIVLLLVAFILGAAEEPANEHFQRTWERTDQPVRDGTVARTWIWGPEANSGALQEDYLDAPEGSRTVQYFDKSRMEINNPDGDPSSPFYVTNGLLVIELMTGRMQFGNDLFEQFEASTARVAGDQDDPDSPSYASLADLRNAPPLPDGSTIIQRLNADGSVTEDAGLAANNVTAAFRLTVPGIDHQVASPFWEFLNSSGPVVVDGQVSNQRLFDPWFYATGYPITEAYWADVKIAGTVRLVLMQCFERRCLTYTPGNPEGFLTEAGNVGQHYYSWRYEQTAATPTPSEDATATPVADATPTPVGDATATPVVEPSATPEPLTDYAYVMGWGELPTPLAPQMWPAGMGQAADGLVWVTDSWNNRLLVYDEHGQYLRTVGAAGTGNGQFTFPSDIAFGDDGRIYVADQNNQRVQVLSGEGVYLSQWGSQGSGDGQFAYASGIGIANNTVYVVDFGNSRVQRFTLEGVYLGQFGGYGSSNGQLNAPQDVAFDSLGNVYVSDAFNHRVQKYDSIGTYLSQFGSPGTGNGQFAYPGGMDIDDEGFIYIVDGNDRLQKFSPNGSYLSQWGSNGGATGQFKDPAYVEIDADGNIYVVDANNFRVQKFTNEGVFLYQISDTRRGSISIPTDITVDQNNNLLISDSSLEFQMLSRYTSEGVPLDDYSLTRNAAGPYDSAYAAAVSAAGDIYVVDGYANRVQRFSSTWVYKGQWGSGGTAPGQFKTPHDIAIDDDGNVYVADSGNNRVQKFDANGVFLDQWGGFGTANGQFDNAASIAIDGERVYVADYTNNRVQVFDREGTYLDQWGSAGAAGGQLSFPIGLGVNPDGYVLVVEYGNNRVQVFSSDGDSVDTFGSTGTGAGQFTGPLAVTVDDDGFAYVTEVGNHRVQKFAPVP